MKMFLDTFTNILFPLIRVRIFTELILSPDAIQYEPMELSCLFTIFIIFIFHNITDLFPSFYQAFFIIQV